MKKASIKKLRTILVLICIVIVTSCVKENQTQSQFIPEIQVVEVIQKDVPIYSFFVGQIYGQEDVAINARVEGFLTGIHFVEGRPVEKGTHLYSIDQEPFKAAVASEKSKVAEAQTRLVNAENELARYKPLAAILILPRPAEMLPSQVSMLPKPP